MESSADVVVILRWVVVLLVFIWWYRRADATLRGWRERVDEARRERPRLSKLIHFWLQIRRPLEWLLLFWIV